MIEQMNIETARRIAITFLDDESQIIVKEMMTDHCYLFFFDHDVTEFPTPQAPIVMVDIENKNAEFIFLPSHNGFKILNEAKEI